MGLGMVSISAELAAGILLSAAGDKEQRVL